MYSYCDKANLQRLENIPSYCCTVHLYSFTSPEHSYIFIHLYLFTVSTSPVHHSFINFYLFTVCPHHLNIHTFINFYLFTVYTSSEHSYMLFHCHVFVSVCWTPIRAHCPPDCSAVQGSCDLVTFTFTFTFSHLADAFVQSDLQTTCGDWGSKPGPTTSGDSHHCTTKVCHPTLHICERRTCWEVRGALSCEVRRREDFSVL